MTTTYRIHDGASGLNSVLRSIYLRVPRVGPPLLEFSICTLPELFRLRDVDGPDRYWSTVKEALPQLSIASQAEDSPDSVEEDKLGTLHTDMLSEVLKYVQYRDLASLRAASRSWSSTLLELLPDCTRNANRKSLFLCTLRHSKKLVLVSNNTLNRRKLFGKVLQFPDEDVLPKDLKMVASDSGLICFQIKMKIDIKKGDPVSLSSADLTRRSRYRLVICNPVRMDYKLLPVIIEESLDQDMALNYYDTSIALKVDSSTLSYKVIVAHTKAGVHIYDSSCKSWSQGNSVPPHVMMFTGERSAVIYNGCLYCVVRRRNDLPDSSTAKTWSIMRYSIQTDTWEPMVDIPNVHQVRDWKICQHLMFPDLVALSNGVYLITENNQHTNKHIFKLNERTCKWRLFFHVPIFSEFISNFGRMKCIGVQQKLFFLLPNTLPLIEIDLHTKESKWCFPVGLHSKHDLEAFSRYMVVDEALPFEPSFYPAAN